MSRARPFVIVGALAAGLELAAAFLGLGLNSVAMFVVAALLHAIAAVLSAKAARMRRPDLGVVEHDLVFLTSLFVPIFGPGLAWTMPHAEAPAKVEDAHQVFERYADHVEPAAPEYERTLFTGDYEKDLARELDAESHYEVLRHGSTDQKRNALRKLADLGDPKHFLLIRRCLVDPEHEVRLYAYAELERCSRIFEEEIGKRSRELQGDESDTETLLALAQAYYDYAASGVHDEEMAAFYFRSAERFANRVTGKSRGRVAAGRRARPTQGVRRGRRGARGARRTGGCARAVVPGARRRCIPAPRLRGRSRRGGARARRRRGIARLAGRIGGEAMSADICLVLEGTYPFVSGGVSSWVHHLTSNLPDLTFTILHISPKRGYYTKGPVYDMPSNVVDLREVPLHDYVISSKGRPTNVREKVQRFRSLVHDMQDGKSGSFAAFLHALQAEGNEGFSSFDLLQTHESWDVLVESYRAEARKESFLNFFWTWRYAYLPLFNLLSCKIPKAKLYHTISTGYAGLLAAGAKERFDRPMLLTEHGIYTKERRIEINRSDWIQDWDSGELVAERNAPFFRRYWTRQFQMMSTITYQYADEILTLYTGNVHEEIKDGADPRKIRIIPNGIDLERFGEAAKEHDARAGKRSLHGLFRRAGLPHQGRHDVHQRDAPRRGPRAERARARDGAVGRGPRVRGDVHAPLDAARPREQRAVRGQGRRPEGAAVRRRDVPYLDFRGAATRDPRSRRGRHPERRHQRRQLRRTAPRPDPRRPARGRGRHHHADGVAGRNRARRARAARQA